MISQAKANTLLNVLFGKSEISQTGYIYLGLSNTVPNAATGVVSGEPNASSYARKLVGGKSAAETYFANSADGGIITNSKEIQMQTARESFGTMTYFFLSESATGSAFMWGELYDKDGNLGIEVGAETVPVFYAEQLKASIDVALS